MKYSKEININVLEEVIKNGEKIVWKKSEKIQ